MSTGMRRLGRRGRFGSSWAEFLTWAGERVNPAVDPWLLYPFGSHGPRALPASTGAVVYATVAVDGTCRYVGKSLAVRRRFSGHASVPGRRQRWAYVAVCSLDGLPEGGLDVCEHVAAKILRPVEGSRHPRCV